METPIHPLFAALLSPLDIPHEDKTRLASYWTYRTAAARTKLVDWQQKTDEIYLILRGCLRKYCFHNGEETTLIIATEGQFALEYVGFMTNAPSQNVLEALEDTEVAVLKKRDLEHLYLTVPAMNVWMRKTLEEVLLQTQLRLNEFILLSPQARYEQLLQKSPEWLHRIPQHILASYLGISATSLSRIRRRLQKK